MRFTNVQIEGEAVAKNFDHQLGGFIEMFNTAVANYSLSMSFPQSTEG